MGSPAPHHRHQSSLEGITDFSTSIGHPSSPGQRDKAVGIFTSIVNYFESSSSTEKPYNRAKLVRLTYEYARSEDSRWHFLQAFFGLVNLPMDGSLDFNDEAIEEEIRSSLNSFADFLVDNFFLPLKASASKTPQPSPAAASQVPSRRPAFGSVQRVASLRRDCLIRDRHRCVISRSFDMKEAERRLEDSGYDYASDDEGHLLKDQEPGSFAELEVAHILPHSLMTTTGNPELNKSKKMALEILDMFDSGIVHLVDGPEIDRPRNALSLSIDLHRQFGNFKVYFEPVSGSHTYQIDSTLRQPFRNPIFPVTRALYLTTERNIDPPSARLLAVHRAICLILHLSAAGNYIDRILRDMDDGAVQADGSTRLANIVRLKLGGWWDGTAVK